MTKRKIFVDRRKRNRRLDPDPCNNLPMDLYHRKRRKSTDRRRQDRTLTDDYYAFTAETAESTAENDDTPSRQ